MIDDEDQRKGELIECLQYFTVLWNERVNAPPRGDLISMMAHADATRHQDPMEYLGNLLLLIVGGNDTTRNSISGGLYALNKFPDEYGKLLNNPAWCRTWCRKSFAGRRRWRICAAPRRVISSSRVTSSTKATVW
ncbi:MAG: hypothetical protein WDN04_23755 [Rhodospirillales bacterium]